MMRKTIARRLTESKQNVPHFYLSIDVDAAPISRLREQINDDLAATAPRNGAAEGAAPLKVSVNDLLIKACAIALVRVPECNASFTPEALLIHRRVDISVAVAVPDGLVTPVVRQADREEHRQHRARSPRARRQGQEQEASRRRDGRRHVQHLEPRHVRHRLFRRGHQPARGRHSRGRKNSQEPVVWEGAVVPGQRLAMTLSCDHRVVDGAVGARFLAELRSLIERPTQMLVF